jgi:hypothetical protein
MLKSSDGATSAFSRGSALQLYFAERYRCVAPYRSTFWCRLAAPLIPTILCRHLGVRRWELRGTGQLRAALREGAGILLTANHCRWADPVVLAAGCSSSP